MKVADLPGNTGIFCIEGLWQELVEGSPPEEMNSSASHADDSRLFTSPGDITKHTTTT
jgi:hypothetical protein